jgi:hypothetical protein
MPPLGLMPEHRLQVAATGEKNPLSTSPAVRIAGLRDQRTCRLVANARDFRQEGSWHEQAGMTFTETPGTLAWNGRVTSAVALALYASQAAGKVCVNWDGKEQLVDLYTPADPASPRTVLLELSAGPDYWTPRLACLWLAAALCMGFPAAVVCLWLTRPQGARRRASPRGANWTWPCYGLPLLAAGGGYLAVFPPALMSDDSLNQWSQMLSGNYSDWHPAFHTMTNWLITRIWFSPAAVAWTQLAAIALVAAWTLARLRHWGLSPGWAWTAAALLGVMPAAGILSITLWKDIPYTIAFLVLALCVMEMIQSRGEWLRRPASAWVLGVVLALAALYRHNGLPVALATPVLLAVPYYRQAIRLGLALLVACGLIWGVRGPLYRAAGLEQGAGSKEPLRPAAPSSLLPVLLLAINHIAAQTAADTPLGDEEREFLNGLYPLQNGKWPYDPCHFDYPMHVDVLNSWQKWEQNEKELTALALRLLRRNPAAGLRHVLASSSALWCITGPTSLDNYYTVAFVPGATPKYQKLRDVRADVPGNVEWVEPCVPLPRVVDWTFRNSWLFWRPALYLHLIVFSVAIAALRGGSARFVPFLLPIFLQSACLALTAPSQDFRFQFPIYLIGLLYGGYFLFCEGRHSACPDGSPV